MRTHGSVENPPSPSDIESPVERRTESLSRVLVATDFSKSAELAVARAALLPLQTNATIELLTVLPPGLPREQRRKLQADATEGLERASERIRKLALKTRGADVRTLSHVRTGQPFVEIIRCSRELDVDLTVLGKHGRRPLRDLLIGSTAEKVVRHGDVPVLIVSGKASAPYRRPLVATALDDTSVRTLKLARRLLPEQVTSGWAVHAYYAPFSGFVAPAADSKERAEWVRVFGQQATARLNKLLASQRGSFTWMPVVRLGDPRQVITAEASRRRADLIVIGTHARSGVAHALLGSVAEWLISASTVDLLIARPVRFSFELP